MKGEVLVKEGDPQKRIFVIADGTIVREKTSPGSGQVHYIDTMLGGSTVGSLHVLNKDPAYATSKCATEVTAYELESDKLKKAFKANPDFAFNVAYSLSMEIRRHTRTMRTPLLSQHPKRTHYLSVSLAAGGESFYRSALNSLLNQNLTGAKVKTLFPNMHIQIPTRIIYINGFKGIRQQLDERIDAEKYPYPTAIRLLASITPGVIMTPVSSLLEASNAGHANPESIFKRWTRGYIPRTAREVIFGIGLNQLSDYCEERVPYFDNLAIRNAAGSLAAGVISGYLSHVVHNLSALKLMNPHKTYVQHFREYVQKSESRIPANLPLSIRRFSMTVIACLLPKGVHIRTAQIVGSFIILNGSISAMQRWFH